MGSNRSDYRICIFERWHLLVAAIEVALLEIVQITRRIQDPCQGEALEERTCSESSRFKYLKPDSFLDKL